MPAGRYLFMRMKSQKRQTKIGQAKNCIKKTDRTNIIAKLRLRANKNYSSFINYEIDLI